jgi:hypothetical protein
LAICATGKHTSRLNALVVVIDIVIIWIYLDTPKSMVYTFCPIKGKMVFHIHMHLIPMETKRGVSPESKQAMEKLTAEIRVAIALIDTDTLP